MNRNSIWSNPDGLYVGFGTRGVETNSASVSNSVGNVKQAVLKIVGADLQATPTGKELANSIVIPAGANIQSVRVVVNTQFATGTSLDIGGYTIADAADDDDGFVIALLLATLVTGYDETYTAPGANKGGAYIGTILANAVKIVPSYNTTAFTAGVATVTITYELPAF